MRLKPDCQGDPAIRFVLFGILSGYLIRPGFKCTSFSNERNW
jgi:hypothetical protein